MQPPRGVRASRHDTAPLLPQRTDKHLQKASLRQAGWVPTLARGPFLLLESRVSFHPIACAGLLLGIACTTAHAGQFANGHWTSNACGPRPEAPAVNGKDDKTYNASVEAANAFVRHDVLATGDYYRSTGYPVVDLINGGTLKGLIDGLGATIALAGPRTKIAPGHGPVVDRAALVAHRDLLLAVRDKVAPLVAQGRTVEDVIAAKPTADFDAQVPQAAQTSERFVRWLYADLKAAL